MASHAQIAANRRNAQQPPQSKIQNPKSKIRYGLLAKVVPAETEGWNELLTGLYESLRPQDELQRFLVDQIAHCMIRLQRSAASEERWLTGSRVIPVPEGRQYEGEESPGLAPLAFARIDPFLCGEHCRTLLRYEAAANRQIKRNLELLMKLQSASWGRTRPTCPYIADEGEMEGAAPSAPLPLRPEGDRQNGSEPGPSGPSDETATQPCVSHTRPHGIDIPQPGSPGLSALQPGPLGPGLEAEPASPTDPMRVHSRPFAASDEPKLASFRNNGIYNGAKKDGD